MSRRRIAAYLMILVLVLNAIRLVWMQQQVPTSRMQASDGVLDLRGWDAQQSPLLLLDGEWLFYPFKLIDPGAESDSSTGGKLVTLPSGWQDDLQAAGSTALGYASYRLKLLLNPSDANAYSIRVPSLPSSSALYVNGERIGGSGVPAERAEDYAAGNVPFTGTFASGGAVVDIVLHVANFDNRALSGVMQHIKFGTEEAVRKSYAISSSFQAAMVLLLIMHAAYSVALYVMGTRHKALLPFTLLMVSALLSIATDDDRILQDWFGVDYLWAWKLFNLSFLGSSAFLMLFARQLMPNFGRLATCTRWISVLCAIYALLVLALPPAVVSGADMLHTALTFAPFVVVPYYAYRATRSNERDMIYILLGMTAIGNNLLWGAAKMTGLVTSDYYPFDMLVTFALFAMYWFKGYFRTFQKTAQLAEQLQAADKQKDDYLVTTSHELRNPLHSMLNMAAAVVESGGRLDEARNRERLELLISVGKRMSVLLDDLADLKRFEDNRVRLRPANLRLSAVASGALDMVRYMTEGKPIRLENGVPDSLPLVYADKHRLIQILFNLLHNAIKFTDKGVVRVSAFEENGKVRVEVADTGIGIDEQMIDRIFLPYEQGSFTESGKPAGLGLGLAIARQLVELHGGALTVKSAPGQGSSFAFSLPLAASAEPEELPAESVFAYEALDRTAIAVAAASRAADAESDAGLTESGPARGDRPRVLAVDDDPVNLRMLRCLLQPEGCELVTAASGAEALALLNDGPWDLLIADVMMPRMSGYELTRRVRERFSLTELPILLLTARSRPEDIEAGFRAGANDYVTKPVERIELRFRVRALTDVARAARIQARTEAAWLQAQIEPHFLFNTLNAVIALSEIDIDRTRHLLQTFGDYLRASFDFRNAEQLVPLQQELELVRAYLMIEQARFGERIRIEWQVDDRLELLIPPLTIQPLVENAVRHGLRAQGGTIRIAVADQGAYAEITVQDDGIGMNEQTIAQLPHIAPAGSGPRKGIGLQNTYYRLKRLYGEGLRIQSAPGQGTSVSFAVRK